ncbi:MAG: energy-coupling factor transporter transmembrane protein EcfT [Eggerthellaceae bacterium]|jgi:energy-coupling factor transport system permease protein|nr:energy-coupling factor transporter transmembrane protein EcfT [Eggerthellaceae bacterium]MDR2722075.1 energy-coupling factor transporter transmembrane protein EcfT [Coriobacteriaceae bacterium]
MQEIAIFGRYLAGTSPVHRMDPRAKLLLSLFVLIVIFCAQSFWGLALCALFVAGFYVIARISLLQAFKSVGWLFFIVIITALFNVFFVQGGTVFFAWGFIQISEAGVYQAAFMGCRLSLLLLSMSLLTLTTTSLDITDAFEYLFTPFTRFGLPAHELAMMMGIALRFLPQFALELQTIHRAQLSRGANFSSSPLKGGVPMITSLVVPLFTSAFRHAETLAAAMDSRCYHGGTGRSRLHPLRYTSLDRNALIVVVAMLILVVASNFIP